MRYGSLNLIKASGVAFAWALFCPGLPGQTGALTSQTGIGTMQSGILVLRGDSDGTLSIDGRDSGSSVLATSYA